MCYALPRAGNGVPCLEVVPTSFFCAQKNQVLIPETLTLSWFFKTCYFLQFTGIISTYEYLKLKKGNDGEKQFKQDF